MYKVVLTSGMEVDIQASDCKLSNTGDLMFFNMSDKMIEAISGCYWVSFVKI